MKRNAPSRSPVISRRRGFGDDDGIRTGSDNGGGSGSSWFNGYFSSSNNTTNDKDNYGSMGMGVGLNLSNDMMSFHNNNYDGGFGGGGMSSMFSTTGSSTNMTTINGNAIANNTMFCNNNNNESSCMTSICSGGGTMNRNYNKYRRGSSSNSAGGGGGNNNDSEEDNRLLATMSKRKVSTPEQVDTLLASELNSLSIDERTKVLEEVHGVLVPVIETPEMITEKLQLLDKEINKIRGSKKKSAYDIAMFMNPSYVTNRSFRLMFLRSTTNYNPTLAAQKLVKHFEYKLELFGINKLTKNITQQDLIELNDMELKENSANETNDNGQEHDEEGKHTDAESNSAEPKSTLLSHLHSGCTQKLPIKDQVGRTILVSCWKFLSPNIRHQVQSWWYLIMTALQDDEETQKRGIVDIIYHVDHATSERDREMILLGSKYVQGVPFRHASLHFCYDNPILQPALSLCQIAIGKEGRLRFRSHYGSHIECQYALSSFGIKELYFPIGMGGKLENGNHLKYLEEQKIKEDLEDEATKQRNSETKIIEYPLSTDVVLGRGKPYHEWAGNERLAHLVEEHRAVYQRSSRSEKTAISNQMLEIVKGWGGRFLKRAEDGENDEQITAPFNSIGWLEVPNDVAREKVSHSFRTKTKKTQQPAAGAASLDLTTEGSTPMIAIATNVGSSAVRSASSYTQSKRPRNV